MFDDNQNAQQAQTTANGPAPDNPAAPPADHQFEPPKPAYDSIFDDQPSGPQPSNTAPAPDTSPTASNGNGDDHTAATADDDGLLQIKKQALEQLSPLLNNLDQSPEEKFHTIMRIIQASDNATLLKEAHQAAQAIEDDKARAQALLDVVNEINYFTKDGQTTDHQS